MPLYEYLCDTCGHRFEKIQRFSDPPVEACPACGAAVRKLISSPAIQFKGSGWYITDYARSGQAGKTDGAGKPAAGDGAAASDAGTAPAGASTGGESPSSAASASSSSASGSADKGGAGSSSTPTSTSPPSGR